MLEGDQTSGQVRATRTGYSDWRLRLLSTSEENDILLRKVCIIILQVEDLVHAVFLQDGEFDENANGTSQSFLNYQVLTAGHLLDCLVAIM